VLIVIVLHSVIVQSDLALTANIQLAVNTVISLPTIGLVITTLTNFL